jgi:creatinine amidohydrolase
MTSTELSQAARSHPLVILPLGCTEQHAAHLPVDADTYQVERVVRDGATLARERHGVESVVLPTMPFGPAAEHLGFAGTISVPSELYVGLVKHVLGSALDSGFDRLGVVRGCTGHWVVPGALWDLKAEAQRAGRTVTIHDLTMEAEYRALKEKHLPRAPGGHAGAMETSLLLAGRPRSVRREAIAAPVLRAFPDRWVDAGEVFLFTEATSTGALGDPSDASAQAGERLWADLIASFADRLKVVADQDRALGRMGSA